MQGQGSFRSTCVPALPPRVLLLLSIVCGVFAPAVAAQDSARVDLDLDQAVFAYSDSTALVELYLAFSAPSLSFEMSDQQYHASVPVHIALAPEENVSDPVWTDAVHLRFAVDDTSSLASGQMFLHQVRTAAKPGSYVLTVEPEEAAPPDRSIGRIQRAIDVADYASAERPIFSDIALASQINRSERRASPFYKNGLLIRPNPRRVYGPGLEYVFYYVELYGPGSRPDVEHSYRFRSYISRADESRPVKEALERTVERDVRSPDVLVGQFEVAELPSGSYELHTEMLAPGGSSAASQERKFYVYNPDRARDPTVQAEQPEISARYRTMNDGMVDVAVSAVAEIASEAEREIIEQLEGYDQKRAFLTRFWARRDPTPQTRENRREDSFYRDLRLVREQYGTPFTEPWETDRGRVRLQYGAPDRVDRNLQELETQPYVMWQYDHVSGDGQVIFVFIDREGFGEFDLVHSTATGEATNPEWRRLIQ